MLFTPRWDRFALFVTMPRQTVSQSLAHPCDDPPACRGQTMRRRRMTTTTTNRWSTRIALYSALRTTILTPAGAREEREELRTAARPTAHRAHFLSSSMG